MTSCICCPSTATVDWYGSTYCSAHALERISTEPAKTFWVIAGGKYDDFWLFGDTTPGRPLSSSAPGEPEPLEVSA